MNDLMQLGWGGGGNCHSLAQSRLLSPLFPLVEYGIHIGTQCMCVGTDDEPTF